MKSDNVSDTGMVGSGAGYAICGAGVTTHVKTIPGRICRIIPQTGTGTVQVQDNGVTVWPATAQVLGAAGIIWLDIPCTGTIDVTCAAATTCLVTFS